MCGQHNVGAIARDNTGQNKDKRLTPSPRIESTFSDPFGNRTRATVLEGRDSTDLALAMDLNRDIADNQGREL